MPDEIHHSHQERELWQAEAKRIWDALEHEKELRLQAEAAHSKALQLQASVYENRLNELNHAHQKQVEERQLTVSSEMFTATMKDMDRWRSEVSTAIAEQRGAMDATSKVVAEQKAALLEVDRWRSETSVAMAKQEGKTQATADALAAQSSLMQRRLMVIGAVIAAITVLLRFLPLPVLPMAPADPVADTRTIEPGRAVIENRP